MTPVLDRLHPNRGVLIHPAAVAENWLGAAPVPEALPLLPDEDSFSLSQALTTSAMVASNEELVRPLPTDVKEPPAGEVKFTSETARGHVATSNRSSAHLTRHYINVAGRLGCRKGLSEVIINSARAHGLTISLGFALINHESGFRKVFGHDPTIYVGAGYVTRAKFLAYRSRRRASGNRLMQGAGEGQLTWWATQDAADRRGGCWRAEANVSTAFITMGADIHSYGYVLGVERYNGYGPAAVAYSRAVRAQAAWWHHQLTSGLS